MSWAIACRSSTPGGRIDVSRPGHSCWSWVVNRPSETRMSRSDVITSTDESPVKPVRYRTLVVELTMNASTELDARFRLSLSRRSANRFMNSDAHPGGETVRVAASGDRWNGLIGMRTSHLVRRCGLRVARIGLTPEVGGRSSRPNHALADVVTVPN